MGENSAIEWTHHTFNPVVGCTKISPACDHCYAETWAKRTGQPELWNGSRRRTSASNWRQPIKWNEKALADGIRRRVFCASLADVFDNQWEPQWRRDLFDLIYTTPQLDWLLLTKRPQNIAKMLAAAIGETELWPWPNVWLGTTVENQDEADRRIPHLLAVPARVRFLSCEPLLGAVDLDHVARDATSSDKAMPGAARIARHTVSALHGQDGVVMQTGERFYRSPTSPTLDWVIAGGESGHGKRPMNLDWARGLRDACKEAGVPFFFKQIDKVRPIPADIMLRQFPA